MRIGKFFPLYRNPTWTVDASPNNLAPRRVNTIWVAGYNGIPVSPSAYSASGDAVQNFAGVPSLDWPGTTIVGGFTIDWTVRQRLSTTATVAVDFELELIERASGDTAVVRRDKAHGGYAWTIGGIQQDPFTFISLGGLWTAVLQWTLAAARFAQFPPPWPQ